MTLITGLVITILLALVIYWLLVITEGIYLGKKVVVWLYDITAGSYDDVKEFDAEHEHQAIAAPLLGYLANKKESLVLDVATGTARVPLLLLNDDRFEGRIIGLDPSTKMLGYGLDKLSSIPVDRRVKLTFIQQYSDSLPFQANSFDVVTCLEALEFFPSDYAAITEMARVLRPGGLLMTTRRQGWESRFFFGRYRSRDSQARMLREAGLVSIEYYPWQVNYDMVMAFKKSKQKLPGRISPEE